MSVVYELGGAHVVSCPEGKRTSGELAGKEKNESR